MSWTYTAQPGDVLDFVDVAEFDWDRMAVFDSYATNDNAREVLGFDWNIERAPTATNDNGSLVGFVSNQRIAVWTVVPFGVEYSGAGLLLERPNARLVWNGESFELPD